MKRALISCAAGLGVLASACSSPPRAASPAPSTSGVDAVADWMAGSYSNAAQAAADPEFESLEMQVAIIWPELPGGHWLYLEQARSGLASRPYRQRIYHLVPGDSGGVIIEIYRIPEAARFVGAWSLDDPLREISPTDLVMIDGCNLLLGRSDHTAYSGSTQGQGCVSTAEGAAYATSSLRVTPSTIEVWDRGFDTSGRQVWGEDGPHVYERMP